MSLDVSMSMTCLNHSQCSLPLLIDIAFVCCILLMAVLATPRKYPKVYESRCLRAGKGWGSNLMKVHLRGDSILEKGPSARLLTIRARTYLFNYESQSTEHNEEA